LVTDNTLVRYADDPEFASRSPRKVD